MYLPIRLFIIFIFKACRSGDNLGAGVVVGFGVVTTTGAGAGGLPPPTEDINNHFHFNVVFMLDYFCLSVIKLLNLILFNLERQYAKRSDWTNVECNQRNSYSQTFMTIKPDYRSSKT